ncbi:transcriptional regulator [Streptomyces yunnanensis]|nr:transcriptional regulator [Streptomyces yunnanensis]
MEAVQTGATPRVGMPEVDMAIAMTERISELDDQFGGGRHARPMAASFLVNSVASYLRAEAAEHARKAMLSAADLRYLTSYMAVDEGLPGLAQRISRREAEAAMDKAESREKAIGSYDPATLNYHISQVRYELGDARGAVGALQQADRLRSNIYRRARVRHRDLPVERQLAIGHLEAACATWHQALDDYPMVQSGRADDRIRAMFGHLRPYLKNGVARAVYERAHGTVPSRLLA